MCKLVLMTVAAAAALAPRQQAHRLAQADVEALIRDHGAEAIWDVP